MNLHEALIVLTNAASHHRSALESEKEEVAELFAAGHYTQQELENISRKTEDQIDEINQAADIFLNFLTTLGFYERSKQNLENAKDDFLRIIDGANDLAD
jgi:hypothetical protein